MADRPTASTVTDAQLDALYADLERARDVAVQLENETARLKDRTKEAKEQARVATVHAYRLQQQTPDAAQRTLDRVRQARTWCDLWVQLGQFYGLKPEECGVEARDRRALAERTAEARAERAEQQLDDGWQQLTESGAMPRGTLAGAIKGLAAQRNAAIARHDEAEQQLAQVHAELAQLRAFRDVVYLEAEHWDDGSKSVICAAVDEYGTPGTALDGAQQPTPPAEGSDR